MATAPAPLSTPKESLVSSLDQSLRNLASEPDLWQSFCGATTPESTTNNDNEYSEEHQEPASLEEWTRRLAPKHMEQSFQQLYRILQPALSPTTTSSSTSRKNASAILQGGRGCGKSLLVQQVLRAFCHQKSQSPFRLVYIHGVVVPGQNVVLVVREMLRQLSQQAAAGGPNNKNAKNNTTTNDSSNDAYIRLKTTSFTNQLQLLSEMIQLASVDGVPIVFVLDELDQFVASHHSATGGRGGGSTNSSSDPQQQHRQLLLYHLLDRVASSHSLCSLIGMTTDCSFLSRLEKRIKSRAEGTTQFLYLALPSSFDKVIDILMDSLVEDTITPYKSNVQRQLKESEPLERCYRLGYNIRWFRRLLYQALALYRYDVVVAAAAASLNSSSSGATLPSWSADYLSAAADAVAIRRPNHDLLSDLRGAQIALVLAARRVLFRESVVGGNNGNAQTAAATTMVPRLTYGRMITELGSFRGAAAFSSKDLWHALLDLLEMGVLRPASDHSGTAPLSYEWEDDDPMDQDESVLQDTTLHLTLDIHREVKPAIDDNVFQCSTALKEWGRKTI
jgi:AAA ATPase domain